MMCMRLPSHTHGAVDNVLARLPGVGVEDYVRVGGELGKASAETPEGARNPGCPGTPEVYLIRAETQR